MPVPPNTLYATRALSEDGSRLYFDSADPLSPRDTNEALDLYQWEAPGSGDCSPKARATRPETAAASA